MIRRLKFKFILINLSLLTLVLGIVFTAVTWSNYYRMQEENTAHLERVLDEKMHQGKMERPPEMPDSENNVSGFRISPAFFVIVDAEGQIVQTNAAEFIDVSEEELQAAAERALHSGEEEGVLRTDGLQYRIRTIGTSRKIAFVDITEMYRSVRSLILSFVIVGAISLIIFFFINLFLARWVFRPLEYAWNQQSQFIADASHELRTPLTVILANQQILRSHPDDTISKRMKWVDYIGTEADRMKNLVDDLLFLAQSESQVLPARQETVCLSDTILSSVLPFESIAFEQSIHLEIEITPDIWIAGNAQELGQLATILTDNACKYTPTGKHVMIRLTKQNDRAVFCVTNTGVTIAPEDLEHLFDRFYRVDKARSRSQGGHGLGLSIAMRIAKRCRGRLYAESSTDRTSFTAVLPILNEKGRGQSGI